MYTINLLKEKKLYAEVWLPYFKQGDDLDAYISRCDDLSDALNAHAEALEQARDILISIRDVIENMDAWDKVEMEGNTHVISITGPESVINALVEKKLAYIPEFYEEYEDDCYNDEYEEGE